MAVPFPGKWSPSDEFGFRAATEAVLGLMIQGKEVNRENVKAWIDTSAAPIPGPQTLGQAMYFAERMINGPRNPDGGAPQIPPEWAPSSAPAVPDVERSDA